MAIRFSISEEFASPPERVFEALIDLEGATSWVPSIVAIDRQNPGPLAVGHSWRETRRMRGKTATEYLEVTALEAPTHLALRIDGTRGSSGRGEFLFDYALAPKGPGTSLTLTGEIDGMGRFMTMAGRLFAGAYKRAVAKDLAALREHLHEGAA